MSKLKADRFIVNGRNFASKRGNVILLSIWLQLCFLNLTVTPAYANGSLFSLGNFLGAIQQNAAQQAPAIAAARNAWSAIDPTLYQCLSKTVSPSPPVLANDGIFPNDPRLVPYVQRCANAIALDRAQRSQAVRDAAEQQRIQAAAKARQAAQARQAAEEAARQKAEEEVQRREQEHRLAEERRLAATQQAAFSEVRKMPELLAFADETAPDLVFLHVHGSGRILRGLDDKWTVAGNNAPVVCWPFETTGASSADFFLYAMKKLELLTTATRFQLEPCRENIKEITTADIILFTTTDLTPQNAEAFRAIADSLHTNRFVPLLTVKQSEYDEKVAADRKRQEEDAAKARVEATKIESGIDDGSLKGIGIFQFGSTDSVRMCADQSVRLDALFKAISASGGAAKSLLNGIGTSTRLSLDEAFVGIKTGKCQFLIAGSAALRKVRKALKRDGSPTGIWILWADQSDIDAAQTTLDGEEKAREQAAAEAAKEAEEQRAKEEAAALAAREQAEKERRACLASSSCQAKLRNTEIEQKKQEQELETQKNNALYAVFTCHAQELSYVVFTCFNSEVSGIGGGLKVVNGGTVKLYTSYDIVATFRDNVITIPLSRNFSITAQAGSRDFFVLHLDIKNGLGQVIFSDETTTLGVIRVSSDDLN